MVLVEPPNVGLTAGTTEFKASPIGANCQMRIPATARRVTTMIITDQQQQLHFFFWGAADEVEFVLFFEATLLLVTTDPATDDDMEVFVCTLSFEVILCVRLFWYHSGGNFELRENWVVGRGEWKAMFPCFGISLLPI